MKLASILGLALVLAACGDDSSGTGKDGGGGGGDSGPTVPTLIAGGGIGGGAISGKLSVFVIDSKSRLPLTGASVRVGAAADASALTGTSDATGLVALTGPGLSGAQIITASAGGYVPSTWFGVNGASVTIPLDPHGAPAVPVAVVSGTITGWDALPDPLANHQRIAIIGYSQLAKFGDDANNLTQDTRMVTTSINTMFSIPSNACIRTAPGAVTANDCNWKIKSRTGKQAHFAILIDKDTKGTQVETDDTLTITGFAIKTGLDYATGTFSGESLALVPDADVGTLGVTFAAAPTGLTQSQAVPIANLGAEGKLFLAFPGLSPTNASQKIPKATGSFTGATYELLGVAQVGALIDRPQTITWMRNVDIAGTPTVGNWMLPPTALAANAGTYSFTPPTGANLVIGSIKNAMGESQWGFAILDSSRSITLPTLTPDPLPSGTLSFELSGIDVTGFSPSSFMVDDFSDKLNRLSQDKVDFIH